MPKFLEDKLKAEYGKKSKVPYKVMNSIGAMHGNKETAKGREMEKKHEMKYASTHIQHHGDGSHTVSHTPHMKASKSAAFSSRDADTSYSAENGSALMSKLGDHLGVAHDDDAELDEKA